MTSSNARARIAAIVLACASASATFATFARADPPTAADLETARALVKEGRALRASGDLRGALEKFKAGHALGQTPVTGLELARTHEMLGDLIEAREVCLSVARMPIEPDETERSANARAEAATMAQALRPRIASIAVRVLGPVGASPEVRIDGELLPPEAIGEPRKVNPRHHVILVNLEGYDPSRTEIDVAEGESKAIDVVLTPHAHAAIAEPARVEPAPPKTPRKALMTAGIVGITFGATIGLTAGFLALGARNRLDDLCTTNKACPPSAHDTLDSARTEGNVSTVAFVIAGAGVVTTVLAAVLFPRAPEPRAAITPWIGPGGAGVRGAF
jgi:hypothetical protein